MRVKIFLLPNTIFALKYFLEAEIFLLQFSVYFYTREMAR